MRRAPSPAGPTARTRRRSPAALRRRGADGPPRGAPRLRGAPRRRGVRRCRGGHAIADAARGAASRSTSSRVCSGSDAVAALLERIVTDLSTRGSARGWHRAAHAIVALAAAAPDRAPRRLWAVHGLDASGSCAMYAARAAATLERSRALETLPQDARRQRRRGGDRRAAQAGRPRCGCALRPALARPAIRRSRRRAGAGRLAEADEAVPALTGRVAAACGRRDRAELGRYADGDRGDADSARRGAARGQAARAAPPQSARPPRICGAWPRRARASRFAMSGASISRCSRPRRRRPCSACASRRVRLLQRPHLPPRRAELRRSRAAARAPTSTSAMPTFMRDEVGPVAARAGRRRHLDARARHRATPRSSSTSSTTRGSITSTRCSPRS